MSCNILYNRTDMTVLPIEDGFYDLLLEKYKIFDPNFQVGSSVIQFKNFKDNDLDNTKKTIQPVYFLKENSKNEVQQDIHNKLILENQFRYDSRDLHISPIKFDQSEISKRTHDTKHNHPSLIGTLDKCKFVLNKDAIDIGVFNDSNVKVLERDFFQDHINKGIIKEDQEIEIICELKYDGISVEADCGLELFSARTRGDTGIEAAADITPILQGYKFHHAYSMIGEKPIGVKFEAIMTKSDLYKFNLMRDRNYKNCRSAIVGLFGSSDAYLYRDLITLIPLAIDRDDVPQISDRLVEINFINNVFISHGEPLRYCYFKGTIPEVLYYIKSFLTEAELCRDYFNFMYDGIVVSYLDENIRSKLGRKNYINKYSMAVKFNPLEKQTIFRGYTYEIGQHGNITPMIHYDPVEFLGTIHTKSTGSSLKRFNELELKYGDFINVTYVNDVIPYVSKLECEHNRQNKYPVIQFIDHCPICNTKLVISDSGNTIICPNIDCTGRSIRRMQNTFDKLNIKGFGEATFKILHEYNHLYKLYNNSKDYYIDKLGKVDGENFYSCLLNLKSNPINDYIIIGAIGFTNIAAKKWKKIFEHISLDDLVKNIKPSNEFYNYLISIIPEIGTITAKTIATEIEFFKEDLKFIKDNFNIIDSKYNKSSKGEIKFSGIRNLQLMEQLITNGYDADEGPVTKKTDILIIPYEGYTSNKVLKAQKQNTKIIEINEFINNINNYII